MAIENYPEKKVVFQTYLSLPEGKSIPIIPEIPLNPIKKI
jgi:hypothetical protein